MVLTDNSVLMQERFINESEKTEGTLFPEAVKIAELSENEILIYQLLSTELRTEFADGVVKPADSYSVIVTKLTKDYTENGAIYNTEIASASDFTRLPEKAEAFFGLISGNTVTPSTLADVIDDWL